MLKKIVLTAAALVALAGISFAMSNPDFIDQVPGLNFKTSTNVKLAYKYDATKQNYAVLSKHSSGDTYFGTSNGVTAIMKKQDPTYLGQTMTLSDAVLSNLAAGDSIWSGYTAM